MSLQFAFKLFGGWNRSFLLFKYYMYVCGCDLEMGVCSVAVISFCTIWNPSVRLPLELEFGNPSLLGCIVWFDTQVSIGRQWLPKTEGDIDKSGHPNFLPVVSRMLISHDATWYLLTKFSACNNIRRVKPTSVQKVGSIMEAGWVVFHKSRSTCFGSPFVWTPDNSVLLAHSCEMLTYTA